MQTLCEIAHLQYEYIGLYFNTIAQATGRAATTDDPLVGQQGLEFWINLTEEETSRQKRGLPIKNYISSHANDLIQLMLQNIIKVDIDDEDEDDNFGLS
jgi:hypothetical protein